MRCPFSDPGAKFFFTAAVIAVFFFTGCARVGENSAQSGDFTKKQARLLAARVLENTPEHTHYEDGLFSWVLLESDDRSTCPALYEEVVRRLRLKYTVYLSEKDMPEGLFETWSDGSRTACRGGFTFSFAVERENATTVKVCYRDWEGALAASSHWSRYKWTGRTWEVIENGPLLVS